jgi:pyruvate dehydrogenase E1 component alpha subunit
MVRGVSLKEQLATMCAKAAGTSGGRDTSHHAGHPERGILSGTTTIGAQVPVVIGAAFALRYRKTDNVAVGFFGDGASGTGNFHEGINLAAVLKVPAILICENNLYAQLTAGRDAIPIEDIAIRAAGYGIPGEVVDGQDVVAVHEAVQRAVTRARKREGPSLIECKTYRYGEHCQGIDAKRPLKEIATWKERDPIGLVADLLLRRGIIDSTRLDEMDKKIGEELQEAIEYAETSLAPHPDEALKYGYAPTGGEM